jgi:SAM-dependent methyltransferase
LNEQKPTEEILMNEPLNISSVWTRQVKRGQQPSEADLRDHLTAVHNANTGFTESVAWNCREANGKNSYQLLADIIDPDYHLNVLDLACGSGVLLDYCNQRFGTKLEFLGVDMNPAELQLARERLAHTDIRLHHDMAQDLSFLEDSSVDVILCHWALTLMDPVFPVFVTAKRVLKDKRIFAALVDGDQDSAPGYRDVHNIIYEHVQREYPSYGLIELGDPRVRTVDGLYELAKKTFINPNISVTPLLLSLNAEPDILACEVANFFYASFALSAVGHSQMIFDLKDYFSSNLHDGASCFIMPANRLVVRST